jgi:hypothetical protein
MDHLGKALRRSSADTLCGTVGGDQLGMGFFQFLEFFDKEVVLAIRDLRSIVDVIELLMTSNLVS